MWQSTILESENEVGVPKWGRDDFSQRRRTFAWWWYKTDFLQAKFDHGDDTDFLKVNFHHGVQMFIPIITNLNVRAMREYLISLLSQLNWMSQKGFQLCEAADPDKLLGLRPNPHPPAALSLPHIENAPKVQISICQPPPTHIAALYLSARIYCIAFCTYLSCSTFAPSI